MTGAVGGAMGEMQRSEDWRASECDDGVPWLRWVNDREPGALAGGVVLAYALILAFRPSPRRWDVEPDDATESAWRLAADWVVSLTVVLLIGAAVALGGGL